MTVSANDRLIYRRGSSGNNNFLSVYKIIRKGFCLWVINIGATVLLWPEHKVSWLWFLFLECIFWFRKTCIQCWSSLFCVLHFSLFSLCYFRPRPMTAVTSAMPLSLEMISDSRRCFISSVVSPTQSYYYMTLTLGTISNNEYIHLLIATPQSWLCDLTFSSVMNTPCYSWLWL